MKPTCPHCKNNSDKQNCVPNVIRFGYFYRSSDSRRIQRFKCLGCAKGFSFATLNPCYRQHKRQMNEILRRELVSNVSMRRASLILNLSRTTVARKLQFLAAQARVNFKRDMSNHIPSKIIEFDDLETFEHSKYKPVAITLAVEYKTRKILSFATSSMPPKGTTAKAAFKKYGLRRDDRKRGREEMLRALSSYVEPNVLIKTDKNPYYPASIKAVLPKATHSAYRSRRARMMGQGELKTGGFDPIFSLNHTCAMLRANICRLIRKTWCTTKLTARLNDHIAIYVDFHNSVLT